VVENLEDMWKVTKLQQERKGLLEKQAASKEMVQLKAETSEPPKVATSPHMLLTRPLHLYFGGIEPNIRAWYCSDDFLLTTETKPFCECRLVHSAAVLLVGKEMAHRR
jgi:hypothetical protein